MQSKNVGNASAQIFYCEHLQLQLNDHSCTVVSRLIYLNNSAGVQLEHTCKNHIWDKSNKHPGPPK